MQSKTRINTHVKKNTSIAGNVTKYINLHTQESLDKYFYTNRICDVRNSLPDVVVDAPSVTAFRRLLDRVDLVKYCA